MHGNFEPPSDPPPSRSTRGRRRQAADNGVDTGTVVIVMRATCERDPTMLDQLGESGLRVCVVPNGAQAVAVIRSLAPAVVLLDLRQGDSSALAACAQLKRTPQVHVIVLADRASGDASLAGLEPGADDMILRPASARDIAAHIHAVVRRTVQSIAMAPGEGLVLDEQRYEATLDGHKLDLTPAEFRLLAMLAAAGDRVLTRREVLDALAPGRDTHERSVDSLVHHLRRKLARVRPGDRMIRSTYGAGYSLKV
jgi:two-component system response regulator BaeR